MKKSITVILAGIILLLMPAFAQADLTGNLIQKGDFTGAVIIDNATGNLESGQWYGSKTGWDLLTTAGNSGAYAKLTEENSVQHLMQAVRLAPLKAAQGQVQVSFDYISLGLITGQVAVELYGSDNQPQYGGSYGTLLGTIQKQVFEKDNTLWTSLSSDNWSASRGYNWYLIDIYTKTQNSIQYENYFGVDNVSVQVTPVPIPPAIWLLISGLTGLGAVRRRFRKK
jgi:hypothetical protein